MEGAMHLDAAYLWFCFQAREDAHGDANKSANWAKKVKQRKKEKKKIFLNFYGNKSMILLDHSLNRVNTISYINEQVRVFTSIKCLVKHG